MRNPPISPGPPSGLSGPGTIGVESEEEEEVRKRRTTMRTTNMMTVFAIQSTKFQIPLILVSWLGLHYSSKVIPHILINVLLTGTFRQKNLLVRTVSATNVNM